MPFALDSFDVRPGVVITTFGAPAYIHLQLALLRRYPTLPVLVVDDASDDSAALAELAREYDADLFVNDHRHGHLRGDVAGFARGLRWAAERGLTHLVKFSRRFIPTADWLDDFTTLLDTRPATVGNWCQAHHFFRTEAFGVCVHDWTPALRHLQNLEWIPDPGGDVIERFLYVLASAIASDGQKQAVFQPWPLLGISRSRRTPGVLWHDVNPTEDYAAAATTLKLPLTFNDFERYSGGLRNAA